MLTRTASFALVALLLAPLSGCPETTPVSGAHCGRIGEPCRLPSGPMGVCSESLAAACAAPPCLACTPQH